MPHGRAYETDSIRVHWDSSRCIHVGICLRTLPSVFDLDRRPWVELSGASADDVAATVERCPTGALRYERLDGGGGEVPHRPTLVLPVQNGPLLMVGDLDVKTPDGTQIAREARLALCRCGMTHNQPFCDNSHRRRNWESGPTNAPHVAPRPPPEDSGAAPTSVVAREDASLLLRGHIRIYHSDRRPLVETGQVLLCRCGHSANKPFCDGSHAQVGFCSRTPDLAADRLAAESPEAFESNPGAAPPDADRRDVDPSSAS